MSPSVILRFRTRSIRLMSREQEQQQQQQQQQANNEVVPSSSPTSNNQPQPSTSSGRKRQSAQNSAGTKKPKNDHNQQQQQQERHQPDNLRESDDDDEEEEEESETNSSVMILEPSPAALVHSTVHFMNPGPVAGPGTSGGNGMAETRDSACQTTLNFTLVKKEEDANDQNDTNNYEELKSSLECPVCNRISLPPVMQCRNGHITCNVCRAKVQLCPVCRDQDMDVRNLIAEQAVAYMTVPCEHSHYGCKVEVQYREKENHEKICKFRPYICPYIECDHKLAADCVVEHVSTAHGEECRRSDGPEITASMILMGHNFGGDGAWSPRLITCFGRTFFDVALTRDRWLHHWVWLLGEEGDAQNYLYEITAFKGNVKYVYGGEVASLRTSDAEIVGDGQCLSISDAIGRRLKDGDKIRYKLKLMKKSSSMGDGAKCRN